MDPSKIRLAECSRCGTTTWHVNIYCHHSPAKSNGDAPHVITEQLLCLTCRSLREP